MRAVAPLIEQLAVLDVDVLLCGEPGVGKERIARALHRRSRRCAGVFVIVNCTMRPPERLEIELFGGAIGPSRRGALRTRQGALVEAAGGTVYLDEIDAMPRHTQARLLEALDDQEFLDVSVTQPPGLSARVIAAATTDPRRLVALGQLRADLHERLGVVAITIPPLRERRQELRELVEMLLAHYAARYGGEPVSVRPETMDRLVAHSWPGNLPQLENVVERIVLNRGDAWVAEELDRAGQGDAAAPRARVRPAGRLGGSMPGAMA
jgi:two-component system, NtrC family, C4-dicarboxylate transport response regulator DctD